MSEYGLTPQGPNIKRLDKILESIHTNLSEKWGVNTQQNPESFLNHMITNFGDRIAELWEFGESIYYSQYPSSAEGASLDSAAQYGGSLREGEAKSYYPIHCTGIDGMILDAGTMISTITNPVTYLNLSSEKEISRAAFNKVKIKPVSVEAGAVYTVAIDGKIYSYASVSDDIGEILQGISSAISDESFTKKLDVPNSILHIEAIDLASSHNLILSDNITTETVTAILNFATTETGDIFIPNGVITNIVRGDSRLESVENLCGYIAGRKRETDTEFRQSYINKIFNRSTSMLESIRSAILNNVQGVNSVAPYENATDTTDEHGRPPHSIEIVCDGGDSIQIAQQILRKKAAGIITYGDTSVDLTGDYGESIQIRFSRPTIVYVWFKVKITISRNTLLPSNYVSLIREAVIKKISELGAGEDVIPQQVLESLYNTCPGVSYFDIWLSTQKSGEGRPDAYLLRSAILSERERAYTTDEMIEVAIDA